MLYLQENLVIGVAFSNLPSGNQFHGLENLPARCFSHESFHSLPCLHYRRVAVAEDRTFHSTGHKGPGFPDGPSRDSVLAAAAQSGQIKDFAARIMTKIMGI